MKISKLNWICVLWLLPTALLAGEKNAVTLLLARDKAPVGVVFEIVGGDGKTLLAAIDRSKTYMQQIKQRFPEVKFTIITHGLEQFSLLKQNESEHQELHQRVQRIVTDDKIPIQVCGAFAEMMDIDSREFTDLVQVVAAAPLALEEYVENGYVVIEMDMSSK